MTGKAHSDSDPRRDRIEHHEVPEGRVVHGHNMTFHGPVYGEVVSDGGAIFLHDALGWGKLVSPAGHIRIPKRAFNATLQSPGGVVEIASAERCLIIGRKVTIEHAVNCQIFAHSLEMGTATGCLMAARNMRIDSARPHKLEPNTVTMVLPELPDLGSVLEPLLTQIAETKQRVDALTERIDAYKADAALSQYLAIRGKVRAGITKLTETQTQGYLLMEERLGDAARALETAVAERRPIAKELAAATSEVQSLRDHHAAILGECYCRIAHVAGETIVRHLLEVHDGPDLSQIAPPMIPKILFRNDASVRFLYTVHDGKVDWSPA
jgi:hypothetical protein